MLQKVEGIQLVFSFKFSRMQITSKPKALPANGQIEVASAGVPLCMCGSRRVKCTGARNVQHMATDHFCCPDTHSKCSSSVPESSPPQFNCPLTIKCAFDLAAVVVEVVVLISLACCWPISAPSELTFVALNRLNLLSNGKVIDCCSPSNSSKRLMCNVLATGLAPVSAT